MSNGKILDIGAGRGFRQHGRHEHPSRLPDVPVLPETLLMMELIPHFSSIDLGAVSQIVLNDPGATIQIFRRAAEEQSLENYHPNRIEDCISVLGMGACLEALSRLTVSRTMNKPVLLKFWMHARQVAECCKSLAEELPGRINADDAYLVGLLHELGSLPSILDWELAPAISLYSAPTGLSLAQEWRLPDSVVDYFSEPGVLGRTGCWEDLIERAHTMKRAQRIESPQLKEETLQIGDSGGI